MKTSLKLHRLQRGMKQSDLADLVNVRRETIGRLEQGQYCPSLRLAMDLARVFGTTVEGSARKVAHFGSWPSMAR